MMSQYSAALMLGIVLAPLAVGCVVYLLPRRLGMTAKTLGLLTSAGVLAAAVLLWMDLLAAEAATKSGVLTLVWNAAWGIGAWVDTPLLGVDRLSGMSLLATGFFAVLVALYSLGFLRDDEVTPRQYYAYYLWVLSGTCGGLLAKNLLLFIMFWGFAGIPLCLLVAMGKSEEASKAAKKSLIILGGTDSLLVLGAAIIYTINKSWDLEAYHLSTRYADVFAACLCFSAAALAKAGAFPFHSWVPDASSAGPVPVAALLPASLDKLLGIYFFARIFHEYFEVDSLLRLAFMFIGVATVLGAVLLALAQHDLRKLLGFHAVSQVGYMVLGIASGTVVGLVGGLFHMLNNTLYKTMLFLTGGAAERRSGTGELEKMGAMAGDMPWTFAAAVVGALAISGVPPLNGFFSKWLVYQGIIDYGKATGDGSGGGAWTLILAGAMFGSALTLASFVKVIYSVYLDRPAAQHKGPKPNWAMTLPSVVMALACLVFGLVASPLPLKYLILPAAGVKGAELAAGGLWEPLQGALFLIIGLIVGVAIYALANMKVREDDSFLGGEAGPVVDAWRFTGVEFYKTISSEGTLREWYRSAMKGASDVYGAAVGLAKYLGGILSFLHSGALPTYLAWCLFGAAVLLILFCLT